MHTGDFLTGEPGKPALQEARSLLVEDERVVDGTFPAGAGLVNCGHLSVCGYFYVRNKDSFATFFEGSFKGGRRGFRDRNGVRTSRCRADDWIIFTVISNGEVKRLVFRNGKNPPPP